MPAARQSARSASGPGTPGPAARNRKFRNPKSSPLPSPNATRPSGSSVSSSASSEEEADPEAEEEADPEAEEEADPEEAELGGPAAPPSAPAPGAAPAPAPAAAREGGAWDRLRKPASAPGWPPSSSRGRFMPCPGRDAAARRLFRCFWQMARPRAGSESERLNLARGGGPGAVQRW